MQSSLFDLCLWTQRAKRSCIPNAPVLVQSVQLCPVAKILKAGGGNTRSVLCSSRAGTNVAFRQAEAAHEEASCPQVLVLQLSRAGCGYKSPLRLAVASSSLCRRPFPSRGAFAAILPAKLKNKEIKIPVQCLKSQPSDWHWHQALLAFLFGVSRQHVCL